MNRRPQAIRPDSADIEEDADFTGNVDSAGKGGGLNMAFADKALINGRIYSPDKDENIIRGEAVLIKDGKIMMVGSEEEAKAQIGEETEVIDCGGKTVLPGMCDAHCHPSIAASTYSGCDLFGIYIQDGETEDEVIDKYMDRLKKFIDEHPGNGLVRGTGWVLGNFQGERVPTRHDIDKICSDRPVVLESFCQHNLWVNTKAIEAAGVDENTPDVYAGRIYREENGYPQGIFNDPEAMNIIKLNVPGYDFTVEQYKEAFEFYQKNYANPYGVTLVQDCMHSDNARAAFKELADEGRLTVRLRGVYLMEPGKAAEQFPEVLKRKAAGLDDSGDDFRIDTIKMFAEGMFSLVEPYDEAFTKENGLPADYNEPLYWSDDEFIDTAKNAIEAGFSVHVHAMGDNAVRQSADCLSRAQKAAGVSAAGSTAEGAAGTGSAAANGFVPRNVIAHLMLMSDEDVKLMAENNIIGNCQPRWMVYDSDIVGMTPMVGAERAAKSYPLRNMLDAGVKLAFGTDFPVTPPPDTMHEIQCAMTRTVFPDAPDYEKFKGKVLGDERPADLHEAIKPITYGGAYQMFLDDITGTIEPGKSADLVIMDTDLENTPADKIYAAKVEKTIFKGEIVYEKGDI